MSSWVSSGGKFSQAEKLHEGDEEFTNDFPAALEGLADSLDNSRLYHCSPGSCDANNNVKLRDPLLCLGNVPALMSPQPTTCVDDRVDKTNIVYHTLASQSAHAMASQSGLSAANSAQASSITQSDWSNIITSINFGQFYDTPFQYVLNAATTPCSKINDESLTYLNQGQSYELKLKKVGEAAYNEQYFMSIVRIIFHERRLQYMEKEQLDTWKQTRPGERILDIDIPLSYGLVDVKIDPEQLSCLHFVWDSHRESSGVYIKLNAISTEFTAKRHGGEKGVPFRIQVETYALPTTYVQPHSSSSSSFSTFSDVSTKLIHCSSCQVKVFKPKGADRKYKTDREKIEKKSEAEKEKYQPAFDYTVLSEIPLEQVRSYLDQQSGLNKPSVTSTSVDCSASPSTSHFQLKPLNQNSFHANPEAFFSSQCNEAGVIGSSPYHLMSPSQMGGTRGSLHLDDNVFHDHSGVLQSSINDFQRIQQLYQSTPQPETTADANFLNCFQYNELSRLHKSPSPVRNRNIGRHHETNECTVSVISPANDPTSPAGSEVKRVIYSPYNASRPSATHNQGPHLLQCQVPSPASPSVQDNRTKDALKVISSTSLPSSPAISKSDDRGSPLRQDEALLHDLSHSSRCHSANSLFSVDQSKVVEQIDVTMDAMQVGRWLIQNRFDACIQHFKEFTGADLLRLSRDDLIQICGTVNGIRLNNALHSKPIRPRLTLYVAAIGQLAERKVLQGDVLKDDPSVKRTKCIASICEQNRSESPSESPSVSSKSDEIQKLKKGTKRSRSPDVTRVDKIVCSRLEVAESMAENQSKKYKGHSLSLEDVESDVHAVFMEVLNVDSLVYKLSSVFLLDPTQIRSVYLRKGLERINVIVNDSVMQNLADGLRLSVDIRDQSSGSMSLQLTSWE